MVINILIWFRRRSKTADPDSHNTYFHCGALVGCPIIYNGYCALFFHSWMKLSDLNRNIERDSIRNVLIRSYLHSIQQQKRITNGNNYLMGQIDIFISWNFDIYINASAAVAGRCGDGGHHGDSFQHVLCMSQLERFWNFN